VDVPTKGAALAASLCFEEDFLSVPSDPIPSLAHHGHATVLSTAFRNAVRPACLLHGNRFGGYRFNAFTRAAALYPKLDRSLVTAFPSPATAPAFADSIPSDVTAWANRSIATLAVWFRTDFFSNLLLGLGPPRSAQRDLTGGCPFTQTVDRDSFRRERSPNGVAKRIPDWTAVGFAIPGPIPRIGIASCPVTRPLTIHWARSTVRRGIFSPRKGGSLAANLARIAKRLFWSRFVSGGLIAGRRLSPCPHFFASHGLRYRKAGLVVRSVLLFRRSLPFWPAFQPIFSLRLQPIYQHSLPANLRLAYPADFPAPPSNQPATVATCRSSGLPSD
jgi:hypothetical protein